MSKDIYLGREGVWRTLPNGVHIFIPDGSNLETEMSKFDEPSWELEYNKSQYADEFAKKITYADFKYHYIDNNHNRIKPSKYAKKALHKCLETRKYSDPEIDSLILGGLKNCVTEFIVNDRNTNWFKAGYERRLQVSVDTRSAMLESISHEIGHAIDYQLPGGFRSYSFVSPKHGKTMSQMLQEEFPKDRDVIDDIVTDLVSVMNAEKELDQNAFVSQAIGDMVDMTQANLGEDTCKSLFGYLTHEKDYFTTNRVNSGTECFAELTASLFCDKDKTFYNIMKKHCPKTVEIYHEIIEEVKSKWKM